VCFASKEDATHLTFCVSDSSCFGLLLLRAELIILPACLSLSERILQAYSKARIALCSLKIPICHKLRNPLVGGRDCQQVLA
jgi:hypothetical protein